mgnify:FL=1
MNWGKGLIISMTLFIAFIIGLVFYMVNHSDSLYTDDYYAKGEAHSETMKAIENGASVTMEYAQFNLTISLGDSGLVEVVEMRHMSNNTLDRTIHNTTLSARKVFTLNVPELAKGLWYIETSGTLHDKPFLKKEKVFIE